jgi:hypothetical protein
MARVATTVTATWIMLAGALGCSAEPDEAGSPAASAGGSAGKPAEDGGPPAALDAPDQQSELVAFLSRSDYGDWAAEPAIHGSSGPHASAFRVYYGPIAARALSEGADTFPKGAAVVKEFEAGGWAVWIKVDADSDEGRGFFWYEQVGDSIYGNARGSRACVGCHSRGRDFLLSSGNFE